MHYSTQSRLLQSMRIRKNYVWHSIGIKAIELRIQFIFKFGPDWISFSRVRVFRAVKQICKKRQLNWKPAETFRALVAITVYIYRSEHINFAIIKMYVCRGLNRLGFSAKGRGLHVQFQGWGARFVKNVQIVTAQCGECTLCDLSHARNIKSLRRIFELRNTIHCDLFALKKTRKKG